MDKYSKQNNRRNGRIWAIKKSKHQFVSYKDRRIKEEEIRKWGIITKQAKQTGESYWLELYEAWEENGNIFSSSEYCENGNFAQWLRSRTVALSKSEMYQCIYDMALAIKQVHDSDIVHMDIKPDNFLVKADNKIKLGDFGLAIVLSDFVKKDKNIKNSESSERIEHQNISDGDVSYLAPEMLSFNVKPSKKVDIFSFGASIIEWFNWSGIRKLPQNGDLWQRLREEHPSNFIEFPDKDLAILIDSMTEKNPDNRCTIEDVLNSPALKKTRAKISYPHLNNKVFLTKSFFRSYLSEWRNKTLIKSQIF